MKYGIYYAYWEKEWKGNYIPYIEKVKRLGFDILEVACGDFDNQPLEYFYKLREEAEKHNVILTGGYGPRPEHNIASTEQNVVDSAFSFYKNIFEKMDIAGIHSIGGALYSYWPVDYSVELDKRGDFLRSVDNMRQLADIAAEYNITLNMEVLNRFEGYMLNEVSEAVEYVQRVERPNVKVMLDTFHMNIEEDNFSEAIKYAGKNLGHMHIGEANRRPPRPGRMPWEEIAQALNDIGYDGYVVMEPFVMMGGQVGKDIKVWRDISKGATIEQLDEEAAKSVAFIREIFDQV